MANRPYPYEMTGAVLRAEMPYLIAYNVPTGSHPILVDVEASSDEEAQEILERHFGDRSEVTLYKRLSTKSRYAK